MKVACYCGAVYEFTYDPACPSCGESVFYLSRPKETAQDFSERIAGFMKTHAEIDALPEVDW